MHVPKTEQVFMLPCVIIFTGVRFKRLAVLDLKNGKKVV